MKKIPVILDTDIGSDIDDSWALALLLRSSELDLKFITTCNGDTSYRTAITKRMLAADSRLDIPVYTGRAEERPERINTMRPLQEEKTETFPETAAQKIVDYVNDSHEPVTLITIGPLINIADALELSPEIAGKINLVGMLGSIAKNAMDIPGKIAEYNVVQQIDAARRVFSEKNFLSFTITPLDTCGSITLPSSIIGELEQSGDPLMQELVLEDRTRFHFLNGDVPYPQEITSILYDTLAVTLAFDTSFFEMVKMNLLADEKGFLIDDPDGATVNVALEWKDKEGFKDFLRKRLLSGKES